MKKIYSLPVRGFNLKIKISENGFPPSPASLLLANNIRIIKGETVCDIGTGCGIQAIIAAKLGAKKVYASDINPYECKITKENARLNKLDNKISVFYGDLLSPFRGKKFDVIITNIPQTPGPIVKAPLKNVGYYGGKDGTKFINKLIKEVPKHLNKNGRFYFQWGRISNPLYVEKLLKKYFSVRKVAKIRAPFGFIELKVMGRLSEMKKRRKAFFYYIFGVPHYDKIIYECRLK